MSAIVVPGTGNTVLNKTDVAFAIMKLTVSADL